MNGVPIVPMSIVTPAYQIRWLVMRLSSAKSVRSHSARSGTSIPASRSTARQYAHSLLNCET